MLGRFFTQKRRIVRAQELWMSDVSQLLYDMILAELVKGESLLKTCDAMGIEVGKIYRFRDTTPERKDAFLQARRDQSETLHEECRDIAETVGDVKRARLMIDTRMKMVANIDPSRYGAKVDVTTNGGDMKPMGLADFYKAADAPGIDGVVSGG